MIIVNSGSKEALLKILQKYPWEFYAYGSRVKGKHKKFSDLDVCVKGAAGAKELEDLRDELAKSDLLIKVDIHEWEEISPKFFSLIEKDLILVSPENICEE